MIIMSSVICDTPTLAERYDKVSNSQFEHGKLLAEELNIEKGDCILDIGCGTGRLAEYISGIIGNTGRIYSIDPAEYRIQVARKKIEDKNHPNISFEVGSGEDLNNFADNSFDTVIMNLVFGWITDKKTALSEVYRVLKPDGLMGITTTSKGLPGPLMVIKDELLKREPYASQVGSNIASGRSITTDGLLQLLIDAGFGDINLKFRRTYINYRNSTDLIEFIEASHFGNYLDHVPLYLRDAYRSDYITELEKRQTAKGIESVWNMLHVIARKPSENVY
ncbi:MAG: methyltransferase domain-containing protein [Candidatus Methanoperedens sp.]|nr:methyltransferase domain-containing protein [Candidatus Methanoperedens sp.]